MTCKEAGLLNQGSALTLMMIGCQEELSYKVSVNAPQESVEVPEECEHSPPDMEGPYYRENMPVRSEFDMYEEEAQSIIVSGYVCDLDCKPIPYAVVEVWHADASGEYDTVSPEMRYYGQLEADDNGFRSCIIARSTCGRACIDVPGSCAR